MHNKSECPGTFVIGPDVSPADALGPGLGQQLGFWAGSLLKVFTGDLTSNDFVSQLTQKQFRLQLVCEACGQPQGEGYTIKQNKQWVAAMLPAMKV